MTGTEGVEETVLDDKIVALGLQISAALTSTDDRDDPASDWIGIRIAELLHESESGGSARLRSEAGRQAQDLILASWERRLHWPRGWPPRRLREMADLMDSQPDPYSRRARRATADAPAGLVELAIEALDALEAEAEIWRLLALRELDVDEVEQWIANAPPPTSSSESALDGEDDDEPDFDADELEAMRGLARQSRNAEQQLRRALRLEGADGRTSADVKKKALSELRRTVRRRQDLLKQIGNAG